MARPDILNCIHEPFGDAFYYGPERLSERYADDDEARVKSGFADVTYKMVVDQLDAEIAKVTSPPSPETMVPLAHPATRTNASSSRISSTTCSRPTGNRQPSPRR